jgi:hypothetical protein
MSQEFKVTSQVHYPRAVFSKTSVVLAVASMLERMGYKVFNALEKEMRKYGNMSNKRGSFMIKLID